MNEMPTSGNRRLPLAPSLCLALSLTFFMAFCAFPEVVLCRYTVVLVFVLLLFIAVRSRLVTVLSILPCALAFFTAESAPELTLALAAIAVIGYGGFALTSMPPLLVIVPPMVACLLGYAITGDPVRALSTLIFVPLALAAALALRLKLSRTSSIAAVSAVLLGGTLIALGATLLSRGDSLSATAVKELVLSLRDTACTSLAAISETAVASGFLEKALTAEELLPAVNSALRLLPATLIVTAELLSYLGCLIAVTLRTSQFPDHPLPAECRVFRMSSPSAILFLFSFALSLLPLGKSDTIGILLISALNLFVILSPGLALCGAIRLWLSFRERRALPPLLLIVLCLWFFSAIPTLLAFLGAFTVLRTEKAFQKNRKNK